MLVTCPGLTAVRDRMWAMILTKTMILVPLYNFVCSIAASPPNIQLQFFTEPLAFITITDMVVTYGQTVLDLVYYVVRTYVYYIHREKQILLGNWTGDMTTVIRDGKQITFYRQTKQPNLTGKDATNAVIVSGDTELTEVEHWSQTLPCYNCENENVHLQPAALSTGGFGGGCLPANVVYSTALDCTAGAGEGGRGAGLAGLCNDGFFSLACDHRHNTTPISKSTSTGDGTSHT